MIRNEPLAVAALESVIDYCDRALVVDTGTDPTELGALADFAERNRKVDLRRVEYADSTRWSYDDLKEGKSFSAFPCSEIHNELIERTEPGLIWILDGDEVYPEETARRVRGFADYWPEGTAALFVPLVWMLTPDIQVVRSDPEFGAYTGRVFVTEGFKFRGDFPHEQGWIGTHCITEEDRNVAKLAAPPFLHFEPMLKPWRRRILDVTPYSGPKPEPLVRTMEAWV